MNIVPAPVHITTRRCQFSLRDQTARCHLSTEGHTAAAVKHKVTSLALSHRNDVRLPPHTIIIGEAPAQLPTPPKQSEGYALICTASTVVIRGADDDGVFWGLVTLAQMANGSDSIPGATIMDYPAFEFRMHHDDISRKQISTLDDFKTIIRRLSYYKIKYYTPYMEDVLFIKSFPDIGKQRGRLTRAEVKAMHKEARLHNVILLPSYSLIGHQENLLAQPQYRKYAREVFQEPSAYDVRKPILKPFLRKVIKDVCELFPDSPYFHACFDEVIGLTEKELIEHANWCAAELNKHGKRMMMWVDMFKNHYGLNAIHKLDKSIMPVEWEYSAPAKQTKAYQQANVIPWGLASYNNTCVFLPNFSIGKKNIDEWCQVMKAWHGAGFGTSMWGDNGYENHRDMCWNLFAYSGESLWTGEAVSADFEKRFQTTFYGCEIPALRRLIERTSTQRKNGSGRHSRTGYWALFRYRQTALVRLVASDKQFARDTQADLKLLRAALRDIPKCKKKALRNADHLDHFTCALRREINTCERILLAEKIAHGLTGKALEKAVALAIKELATIKRLYRKLWLRHNKRPNIEVSLAVYDEIAASLRAITKAPSISSKRYSCLDLRRRYDQIMPEVGGVPLGISKVNAIPFSFAPPNKTHLDITPKKSFSLKFPPTKIRDIHLICGGQGLNADAKDTRPIFEIILRRKRKIIGREKLCAITHICDWWAPDGSHMWAGGGFKYVDPQRVRFGVQAGSMHGIMHLSGFSLSGIEADSIEITALDTPRLGLFAATLEHG